MLSVDSERMAIERITAISEKSCATDRSREFAKAGHMQGPPDDGLDFGVRVTQYTSESALNKAKQCRISNSSIEIEPRLDGMDKVYSSYSPAYRFASS
jgi:hypothetical protein